MSGRTIGAKAILSDGRSSARNALRTLAKGLIARLPWYIRKSITDVHANWRGRKPSYAGVYSSFDAFAGTMIVAEQDQVAPAIAALIESRNANAANGLQHHRRGRGALSQAVAMLGADGKTVRVLDYGGAAGADFNNLLISNGADAKVEYRVVDFPAVCAAATAHWARDPRITFSPEMPTGGEEFDIVYSWGSVQYAPDPIALLTSFTKYQPAMILIIGTAFSNHSFVRGQVNQSQPFPHWVMSLKDTEAAMLDAGYRLICRQAIGEVHNVDNFPAEYRVDDYASLMFARI